MKRFVVGMLAVIGALAVIAAIVAMMIGILAMLGTEGVPRNTILEIDLERGLVEHVPEDPFARAMMDAATDLRDVVDGLEAAADDDRVVGLFVRLGSAPMGMARIQEVRDAVARFRESGKPAVAFAETFGEFGPGNGNYYLATAFDTIYLQPSGNVGMTGIMYQSMFMKGTYEKLGIEPEIYKRYEYKNAANSYTHDSFNEPHREALEELMDSQFSQLVAGIAETRGQDETAVRDLFDRGPYLAREALEAGLVDGLAYRDEAIDLVKDSLPDGARMLYIRPYLERGGRPHRTGKTIALVYGLGAVVRGSGGFDPWSGSSSMGSDTVAAALRSAVDDPSVEAIVFRVSSPGGSYVASDTIWRETVRAREAGKPVIVTMGDVAGSGGYFVAMAAEKIVAQPGTITASIGVYGGKMVTKGLMDKLGLTFDEVHTSNNSAMFSGQTPFSESEKARIDAYLDAVYADFTGKVAHWRELPAERVHEIARGRIWTGQDALELGLVDELGGFPAAIRLAREAAGIRDDESIRIRLFPRPRSPFESLFGEGPDSSEDRATAALVRVLRTARPVVRTLDRVLAADRRDVLAMPEIESAP